jgi:hypothetical protein
MASGSACVLPPVVGGGKRGVRVPEASLDPSHDEESQSNPTEIEPNLFIRPSLQVDVKK